MHRNKDSQNHRLVWGGRDWWVPSKCSSWPGTGHPHPCLWHHYPSASWTLSGCCCDFFLGMPIPVTRHSLGEESFLNNQPASHWWREICLFRKVLEFPLDQKLLIPIIWPKLNWVACSCCLYQWLWGFGKWCCFNKRRQRFLRASPPLSPLRASKILCESYSFWIWWVLVWRKQLHAKQDMVTMQHTRKIQHIQL